METIAEEVRYVMVFESGDIQLLYNQLTAHGHTLYEDWAEPERKRHVQRLWLATPDGLGLIGNFLERYEDL